jgi:pimeloyl-CoA synthetase
VTEVKKEEYKKPEPVKEEYKKEYPKESMKPVDYKKEVVVKKEEKKSEGAIKLNPVSSDRLKSAMKARIAKLPSDTRDATLAKLETTLMRYIETARAKNAKLLVARYEILLSVVQEEMGNVDDEVLVNSLFQ